MSDIKAQIAPTLVRLNETFDSLKITIGALNSVFDPTTKNNLRSFVANMNATSAQLAMLMDARHGALAGSLNNMNAITGNLAANNAAISSSIRNVETATSNLAATDLKGTVETMRATILDLQNSIKNLNSPNGTLGLMMNDHQLYDRLNSTANRLNSTALSAEILLDDIRINPKRYVNISVFGGKNKGGPITSPAPKDTIPK
jgi:phospholipid/cholesterol/gamma-HCH transport system substrate-binding protein